MLVFVAAINVAIFGLGLFALERRVQELRTEVLEDYSELLIYNLQNIVEPGGGIRVAPILDWPFWERFDDAVIVSESWDVSPERIRPLGAFLNPVGLSARSPEFDEQAVLRLIQDSISHGEPQPGVNGLAIPVLDRSGNLWGGCWVSLAEKVPTVSESLALLFPWFLATTVVLTLGTFWILRRFVLDPVALLADGARQISEGDLSVRLDVPARRDEMAELIRVFNAMTSQVQGYSSRLAEDVEVATEQVRRAEASAMTSKRLAAMGELAAGIAHEINNPLGGLLNAVEALSKGTLSEAKEEQYHGLLRDGLERIRKIVSKLLKFTPRDSEPRPFDLLTPTRDALVLCRHRIEALGVELSLEVDGKRIDEATLETGECGEFGVVLGEQGELGQALLNLLVNALDALEEVEAPRRIDLELRRDGGFLILKVQDNGPGMSRENLSNAADLFFTTKEVGRGTGLGLSIVHKVIHQHSGELLLTSAVGEGFSAEITLPVWSPEA